MPLAQRAPRLPPSVDLAGGEFSGRCGKIRRHSRAILPRVRNSAAFRRRIAGTRVALSAGMITKERVEAVLNRVRPFMQADGGDIELVALNGNSADVKLTGMCAGCPSAHMTLYLGVETALREEIPEFESLRLI
jgi:Fe-S cluster biogenesis protein NfuA